VLFGLPGQTWDSLAADLLKFRELDLDMIGCGPYIAHPATPLGRTRVRRPAADQAAGDELTACKVLALSRLLCPAANIPSTTAMTVVGSGTGLPRGLQCGANVLMPCLTPWKYRRLYEIYPGKPVASFTRGSDKALLAALGQAGRQPGVGPGSRRCSQ